MSVRRVAFVLVGALAGLLFAVAGVATYARLDAADAQSHLRTRWVPAETATISLEAAYVNQETGQRGYLLTADPNVLAPYIAGRHEAVALQHRLQRLLAPDATAEKRLAAVVAAAARWERRAAAPQIAARRQGPISQQRLDRLILAGKADFDTLRARLSALIGRTGQLVTLEVDRIASTELRANIMTGAAALLAILVASAAVPLVRRTLTRPLEDLLTRVRRVAGGDYETEIPPDGPLELALIGREVDRMRASILQHSSHLVSMQHQLTLREERVRLAANLHAHSIQRVFGLGLSLSAAASRHLQLQGALEPLIDETDQIIRELRAEIFETGSALPRASLPTAIGALVRQSERALGFVPALELRGPVETASDTELAESVLAVLREALRTAVLSNGASAAEVTVAAENGHLSLTVVHDGSGEGPGRQSAELRLLAAQAARLHGQVALAELVGGGVRLEWSAPLATPEVAHAPEALED